MLERSNIFSKLAEGRGLVVNYSINVNDYTMGYYLVDGIYSKWLTFVKIISTPQGEKRKIICKSPRGILEGCRACIWSASSKIRNCMWTCKIFLP